MLSIFLYSFLYSNGWGPFKYYVAAAEEGSVSFSVTAMITYTYYDKALRSVGGGNCQKKALRNTFVQAKDTEDTLQFKVILLLDNEKVDLNDSHLCIFSLRMAEYLYVILYN